MREITRFDLSVTSWILNAIARFPARTIKCV
jgi:hypothetical protein